jgi:hypothetical protein
MGFPASRRLVFISFDRRFKRIPREAAMLTKEDNELLCRLNAMRPWAAHAAALASVVHVGRGR